MYIVAGLNRCVPVHKYTSNAHMNTEQCCRDVRSVKMYNVAKMYNSEQVYRVTDMYSSVQVYSVACK